MSNKTMTEAQLMIEIEKLKKENLALKSGAKGKDRALSFKISKKGAISVYGLGRFPVTLYKRQWQRLEAQFNELMIFASAVPDDAAVATGETEFNPETGEVIQDKVA